MRGLVGFRSGGKKSTYGLRLKPKSRPETHNEGWPNGSREGNDRKDKLRNKYVEDRESFMTTVRKMQVCINHHIFMQKTDSLTKGCGKKMTYIRHNMDKGLQHEQIYN